MSVRSASRGSPAAKSIRLALRTSSSVETRSASFVRLRCFGRRCLSSQPTLSAISLMPFIMWFQGPPGGEPLNHTPLPHVNSLSSKPIDGKRFNPSIILLYIAASVEQYCDITQVNALPQNEGILELLDLDHLILIQKSYL